MKQIFTLFLCLGMASGLFAQNGDRALGYMYKNLAAYGLIETDVADLRVADAYPSPGGVEHVYVDQYFNGYQVFNAQSAFHFRGATLVSKNVQFAAGLAGLQLPSAPTFSANNAVVTAVHSVAPAFGTPVMTETVEGTDKFVWPAVSNQAITARLLYFPIEGEWKLAYEVLVDRHDASMNYYAVIIDAMTGDILRTDDLVLHCDFGAPHQHDFAARCASETPAVVQQQQQETVVMDGSTYNVFPFGVESPIHGERSLEVEPADSVFSPFGWHDTDGAEGAEFTITRGNNAWSYPDRETGDDNDNTPDGQTAPGGTELTFDYPFSSDSTADYNLRASIVQSFYTTNKMHDFLAAHGFDEASGNFQETNYTGAGIGRDPVLAEVQDGSGTDNANFSTPGEGSSPRMQMMLFNGQRSNMQILAPQSLIASYIVGTADFGPNIALNGPYVGEVAEGTDGTAQGNLGCNEITNGDEIDGKIAIIDRGECLFVEKVINAQRAGAIGVIICNNVEGVINMTGPVETANLITIPSVNMQMGDCQRMRAAVANGETVRVRFEEESSIPAISDFDAGIVAHEYGHGVSTRLVGGPSNSACLRNDEQMGEGWSDFFTLATTPFALTDTPDGTEGRGIGNYAVGATVTGGGIRSEQYSTDPAVNTKVYNDVIFTGQGGAPHPLGEVWAATLWDIYWYFTDKYGLDADVINGTGGNNRAVQLVIEGLKYTPCSPGLVGGRNGILEANRVVFGGEDQCDLYQIFADRGIGFSAEEGSTSDRTDNRQAFDISPRCNGEIRISKTADSDNIDAGEEVSYTIRVRSFREETAEKVTLTETIPEGMTLIESSVNGGESFNVTGNTIVFSLGNLPMDTFVAIRYDVTTDISLGSDTYFFDGAEDADEDDNWEFIDDEGNRLWEVTDTTPYAGDFSYYVVNVPSLSDQLLQIMEPITVEGDNPALRFFTQYDTEPGWDGGRIELSTNGTDWTSVPTEDIVRGQYRGPAAPTADRDLGGVPSFWGKSDDFEEIIVDLADYAGEELFFRFRFTADDNTGAGGWWVDDIELLDVVRYDSETRLQSDSGDDIVITADNYGVVAFNAMPDNTTDPRLGETTVSVFPNPAQDVANVQISTERAGSATVQLLTVDGRVVFNQPLALLPGLNRTSIATDRLPAGMYTVQVTGAERVSTTKLMVR